MLKMSSVLFSVLAWVASGSVFAASMGEDAVKELLLSSEVSAEDADTVVDAMKKHSPGGKIAVQAALYQSEWNAGFFHDTNDVSFDIEYMHPRTGALTRREACVTGEYASGGFKIEVAYRWVWLFLPEGVTIDELPGASYGRGIGVTVDVDVDVGVGVGVDVAVMPGANRPGTAFLVAPKVGLGGGIIFPRVDLTGFSCLIK